MSNTDVKSKVKRQKAKEGIAPRVPGGRLPSARRVFIFCLLPFAFCLLTGCRMDMQDQPKYKYYRAGDKKFFADGASVRPIVEGTVPRQTGGEYRDREDYFYTGKGPGGSGAVSGLPGGGAQTGARSGGVGAAVPNIQAAVASGALANATPNVRGNTAGGVPGAREAAATGGPDNFPVTIDEAALRRGRERFQIYCTACHGMTGEGDGMIVRRGFRRPPSFYDDRLQEGTTPAAHFFDVITNGWGAMPDYAAQVPPEDRWKIIAYIRALQLSRKLNIQELSPEEQQKVRTAAQRQQQEGHEGGTYLQSQGAGGEKH
jgi:mono/diheme cytochrome c family protein